MLTSVERKLHDNGTYCLGPQSGEVSRSYGFQIVRVADWPRVQRAEGKVIAAEWQVSGWPTLYLIDHQGIIRKRWVGSPAADVLDQEIKLLVEAAVRDK